MPRNAFVDAGNLRIHYLEHGAGVPLVCLHGGTGSAAEASDRIGPLADSYHVYAPDSRGHGATSNPANALSYPQMADDLAAFIDALGLDRPLLFGYSDGGQILLEFGLRHPGKARALAMGGIADRLSPEALSGLVSWGYVGPGEIDHNVLEAAWGDYYRGLAAQHDNGKGPDYWRTLLGHISVLWHGIPTYTAEQIARVAEPALVICGDRDELGAMEAAPRIFSALPRGELSVIANADHGVPHSPLFWAAVRDFLGRHA